MLQVELACYLELKVAGQMDEKILKERGVALMAPFHIEKSIRMSLTRTRRTIVAFLIVMCCCSAPANAGGDETSVFRKPDPAAFPNLFVWTDTCNVYVLRDGNEAVLINLGDGSVLDHLPQIGVDRVPWVLMTDHHREQHQGVGRLDRKVTRVIASKAEQALFETPTKFRKWRPKLGDRYTVHGASYVRPPRHSIRLDKAIESGEKFVWKGYAFDCVGTPGHSPGGITYMIRRGERTAAFIGGVMHNGAKMSNWFDSEWDYGFAKGIDTLIETVKRLRTHRIDLALPSHGPPITNPMDQLRQFEEKLVEFRGRYVRGYAVFSAKPDEQDAISKPTVVPNVNRVSPHLYKLSREHAGKNFAMIVADSGKALVLDCGLFPEPMLKEIIAGMRKHLGLKEIDALWVSHMHGDHFLLGPILQRDYGVETWTLDRIADKCEQPHRYDYAALVNAYSDGFPGMRIDKPFKDGETIEWEGYKIQVDWMPGQTEFGCCLWLELDGKRVAFTGDNLFGNPRDITNDGHECVVARNSGIIEEGYLHAARYLKELKPDLLMGGHSYVMDNPAEFIDRYHAWSLDIIRLYEDLLPERDYEYLFDPYWVSAYPYRVDLSRSQEQTVTITVRNFRDTPQRHRLKLRLPPGVTTEPNVLAGTVPPHDRATFRVKLASNGEPVKNPSVHIATVDITLDGKRYGELFDFILRLPGQLSAR